MRGSAAGMGTPEFPNLGKHCCVGDCNQIDFLPFTCDRCDHVRFPQPPPLSFSVCGCGDALVTCSELDCCCKLTCVLNRSSVDYGARELIFPWKSSRCVRYLEIDLGSSSSLGANRIVII